MNFIYLYFLNLQIENLTNGNKIRNKHNFFEYKKNMFSISEKKKRKWITFIHFGIFNCGKFFTSKLSQRKYEMSVLNTFISREINAKNQDKMKINNFLQM